MLHIRQPMLAAVIAISAGLAEHQAHQAPPEREPAAALSHAIRMLTNEARQARRDQSLPRAQADFAVSYPDPVHPEMLGKRLLKPIDRDSFIDSYVRWQLTGFDAELPEMSDREFERFVEDLPTLVPSPRADERLINDLQAIQNRGELSEAHQKQVNDRIDRMARETGLAADLNLPAERFREWARGQAAEQPDRAIILGIEHAAAQVRAGWPAEEMKREIHDLCEQHRHAPALTSDHRVALERIANRVAGTSRLYVISGGIRANALAVSFEETGIYDFDANRWMRALRDD